MPNTTRNKKKTPYLLQVKLYGRSEALDEMCCHESRLLRRLFKSQFHGQQDFKKIKDKVLEKALDFCKRRGQINLLHKDSGDQNLQDKLNEFDSNFLNWIKTTYDDNAVIDLMDAACRMEIDSMLDLLLDLLVEIISQKTPEEIEKIFTVHYNGDDRTFDAMKYIMGIAHWVLK